MSLVCWLRNSGPPGLYGCHGGKTQQWQLDDQQRLRSGEGHRVEDAWRFAHFIWLVLERWAVIMSYAKSFRIFETILRIRDMIHQSTGIRRWTAVVCFSLFSFRFATKHVALMGAESLPGSSSICLGLLRDKLKTCRFGSTKTVKKTSTLWSLLGILTSHQLGCWRFPPEPFPQIPGLTLPFRCPRARRMILPLSGSERPATRRIV